MLDMQYPEGTAQFLDWKPTSGNCTNISGPGEWATSGRTPDPGKSMTCTASYRVTGADVARGYITNAATVTGKTPSGAEIQERSTRTVRLNGVRPPAPVSPITRNRVPVTG